MAQTCRKNPLTPYINTDQTARDMDLIRALAGDAKLNFIGYSYGTWLGAWYASLFPERIGRMLFDSSMNFAGTFDDALLLSEMGRQRVMDDVLAPYAARHPDQFNLGGTAAQVQQALMTLPPALKTVVFSDISNSVNKSKNAANAMLELAAGAGSVPETPGESVKPVPAQPAASASAGIQRHRRHGKCRTAGSVA